MARSAKTWLLIGLLASRSGPLCAQVAADLAGAAPPPEAVIAGEIVIEPPTLENLGFEWFIQGDTNRNAAVAVAYREQGAADWREGMPLLRLDGERIYAQSRVDIVAPNMFAGSVLDLVPDTAYELRLRLSDPDGVAGSAERTLRVRPGDTIVVHAGTYRYDRYEYTNDPSVNRTTPLDGTYYLTADGTAERPIAIVAAGDGEVVFDGNGNHALFDVRAADHHYFEGIIFRNAEIAILAGTQFLAGSRGLTVKRSRFEDVGAGVFTNYSGSSGFYIADSTFIGRNDPDHMMAWRGDMWAQFEGVDGQAFPPRMLSYVAVKLYGPGHVVAHNTIANFHDGINVETYGSPDGTLASGPGIVDGPRYPPPDYWDRRPVAIDFYNNLITNSHDNPIEADGSMHNVRIMRNLFINHPSHAFCNQPALGGPVYWIRNIAYNLHWRNNLMLGQNAAPEIFSVASYTAYSSSDFNGFRPNPDAANAFVWALPASGVVAEFTGPDGEVRLEPRAFASLEAYSRATGQDANSVLVDYDIFNDVPRLDARDAATLQQILDPDDYDFGLRRGAAAVDAGTPIPNVTGDFSGAAPDLGALERGAEAPHYGPRP
jgi:hypothetical protein